MFKIWLESNEFEGIKNPVKYQGLVDFWLELMMILMFLTGAGVLGEVFDALKIFRFQPNFKHSSLRVCAGHP